MNRRNLLAAALGLPLAPLAALAAPMACVASPTWLRNAARGVPTYEFHVGIDMGSDDLTAIAHSQASRDGEFITAVFKDGVCVWEAPK